MSMLIIRMFGRLRILPAEYVLHDVIAGKAVELLCYVLLHRQAPIVRECLADLLWDDLQSRRHLRQTLCLLRKKLHTESESPELLLIENDSVRLNPQADFWFDVAEFEQAYQSVAGIPGKSLTTEQAQSLHKATDLYRGDLLEGWYQDWCLSERERLRDMYVTMLSRLMHWCGAQKQYEQGVNYGESILRFDRAHERTHRAVMMLRYQAGDRTGALRQYDRCVAALADELDVAPSRRTIALCEQIRADHFVNPLPVSVPLPSTHPPAITHLHEKLDEVTQLLATLTKLAQEMRRELDQLEAQRKNGKSPESDEDEQ